MHVRALVRSRLARMPFTCSTSASTTYIVASTCLYSLTYSRASRSRANTGLCFRPFYVMFRSVSGSISGSSWAPFCLLWGAFGRSLEPSGPSWVNLGQTPSPTSTPKSILEQRYHVFGVFTFLRRNPIHSPKSSLEQHYHVFGVLTLILGRSMIPKSHETQ